MFWDHELVRWAGVLICLMHSGMFSGLTLGFFGLSRLRLEIRAEAGDVKAAKVLALRKDSHFLLATLLWGNVGVNVLLTLLTDSVMTGLGAFVFSTVGITIFGEIVPQAYFSRNALTLGAFLIPVLRFYQALLFLIAKPTGWLLDIWLGKEGPIYFQENEMAVLLRHHAHASTSDLDMLESIGAINFMAIDDLNVEQEGERINPQSIIALPEIDGRPQFPRFERDPKDSFLREVNASGEKWVIITDLEDRPLWVLECDQFLRDALFEGRPINVRSYFHKPIIIKEPGIKLGKVLRRLKVEAEHAEDDVIDQDLVLYWTDDEKRIITGSDLLGRLLRGIVKRARKTP